MDEYRGFRIRHCAYSVNGCYRISIILAFLCARAKNNQIGYVWTRISDTCGQGLIVLNFKKCSGQKRRVCEYTANVCTLEIINNKVLTSLGFSRRCWTIVRRNSSWHIWIPLMRSSCSESAKNMQFPSPWLSDIAKPFSNAVLFKASESSVLLDSMRASSRICWSARKMGSPKSGRWKRQNKIEVISRQFNRRWW